VHYFHFKALCGKANLVLLRLCKWICHALKFWGVGGIFMFIKSSMRTLCLILATLLALSVFIVNCNCGDDDEEGDDSVNDDIDDDADDDDDDGWPDNTASIVGWVAIGNNSVEREWEALYEIREDDYLEVTPPGDYAFFKGSLATRDIGWALNPKFGISELYRLEDGAWTLMDPQPPCPLPEHANRYSMKDVKVFPDGGGYVVCYEDYLMEWDLEKWTAHEIPSEEANLYYYGGIDCLAWDDCVIWDYFSIFWWDGNDFVAGNKYDTSQMVMQNAQVTYRISNYVSDDGNTYSIEVQRDGVWTDEDIHFPDEMDYASMTRIDEHHTVFHYNHDSESVYVILKDDGTEVPESWPTPMWPVAFAEGAGGLGESNDTIYRILGTEREPIFNYGDVGSKVLILAADAE
jgi:hypothetical protein